VKNYSINCPAMEKKMEEMRAKNKNIDGIEE